MSIPVRARHAVWAGLLVVAVARLVSAGGAQTGNSSPLTPVPCPTQAWEHADPTFQPLPGARAFFGRYEGGLYNIEIPSNWNGELVLWAHGLVDNSGPQGSLLRVQVPELRQHWIQAGIAWGASSYRCNGSVYGIGLLDTMALRQVFVNANNRRAPSRIYLVGRSLGGRVTLLGLRHFPDVFAGGLAMCAMGQETNDLRVAFRAAAEFITGVRISESTISQDLGRMAAILGTPPDYTPQGRQLASLQIMTTGGARPFALEGVVQRLLANVRAGATTSPPELLRASTNVSTRYQLAPALGLTADDVNRRVRRIPADAVLRSRSGPYVELQRFDGRLLRPLLTLQGTGDLQVPISQQQAWRRATLAAKTERLLVQRIMRIPGHCAFNLREETRAFDDLVRWVRTGAPPAGDDVFGDLRNAGRRFTEPLRAGDPGGVGLP